MAAFWRAVIHCALGAQLSRLPQGDPDPDPSVDDAECLRRIIAGFYRSAVDTPPARRPGRGEVASPDQLTATAEQLAVLVVNGLLATGSGSDSRG
ncbi:hypothetical protein [Streptomyces cyaneus]|uniref:hypothetical protein n=1 Tax=Streptomyces cyaneus TaxID=1904 RepID=UPI001FEC97F8|nr:hypothetical protein [Streptomyces cyaneus]